MTRAGRFRGFKGLVAGELANRIKHCTAIYVNRAGSSYITEGEEQNVQNVQN